ncbi:hypothetical protein BCIN_07g04770 [Botrytis cinerea B05.10]|uniref:PA14 domain-containing protein n=2 Tax=Botryotinia fuckeliana TaxID=40559 RepID=A0A384JN74_BOTFB|nr:hypothetical protein BCIN_07g04770 [Botrytis cinerea B05.10]ATZ51931.1 hypothetical protein BCIN_07g04770 [Botrytis cinerea B05.10]CCD52849.1 hypothetical protein BofuT4_P137730.1 [Botrytis cinerea T4]
MLSLSQNWRSCIAAFALTFSAINASPVPGQTSSVLSVVSAYNGATTITASTQVVTYAATTTSTSGTLTCTKAGTYSIGTSTTVVSKPTTIPWTAPEVIYEYCPFSVFTLFGCATCPRLVTVEKCYLGYCEVSVELRTPSKGTTSTSTSAASSTNFIIGIGYLEPTVTTTKALSAYATGYTSTIPAKLLAAGTVIVGSPIPYVTTTTYLDDGSQAYTSTIGGTILDAISVTTITYTTTVSAYDSAYTSTISAVNSTPGTVIVATPAPYVTSTIYLDNGESAYTSTIGGDVNIGVPVGTVTTTTFLPTDGVAFTSTVPAAGPTSGTVLVGYVQSDVTTTITGSVAATSTIAPSGTIPGTIIVTVPTPDVNCNNIGVQFAAFAETPQIINSGGTYANFDPVIYKTQPAKITGNTTAVSYSVTTYTNTAVSVYGSTQKLNDFYLVIDNRGYLFAQMTGTYTFSTTSADDIFFLWVGANAYSGWTRANANLIATLTYPSQKFTINLVAGEYYPMRFLWANGDGPGLFAFSVTAPDGTTILDGNTVASPYVVQFSCDGTSAPEYPAWGAEN